MAEALPGAGNVHFELDGKPMELVPSLQACIAISGIAGGLNAAIQRCLALDFETICAVITAGLNLNPTQAKNLREAVFRTGLIDLSGPCIEFVHVVSNGGRPVEDEEGGDEADQDPPPPA